MSCIPYPRICTCYLASYRQWLRRSINNFQVSTIFHVPCIFIHRMYILSNYANSESLHGGCYFRVKTKDLKPRLKILYPSKVSAQEFVWTRRTESSSFRRIVSCIAIDPDIESRGERKPIYQRPCNQFVSSLANAHLRGWIHQTF